MGAANPRASVNLTHPLLPPPQLRKKGTWRVQSWVDIHEQERINGGGACLTGESGILSKWIEMCLEAEERKEFTKVAPSPQDNTGRCWTLPASAVTFLAEEVESKSAE